MAKNRRSLTIRPSLVRALKAYTADHDMSASALVENLVAEKLGGAEPEELPKTGLDRPEPAKAPKREKKPAKPVDPMEDYVPPIQMF